MLCDFPCLRFAAARTVDRFPRFRLVLDPCTGTSMSPLSPFPLFCFERAFFYANIRRFAHFFVFRSFGSFFPSYDMCTILCYDVSYHNPLQWTRGLFCIFSCFVKHFSFEETEGVGRPFCFFFHFCVIHSFFVFPKRFVAFLFPHPPSPPRLCEGGTTDGRCMKMDWTKMDGERPRRLDELPQKLLPTTSLPMVDTAHPPPPSRSTYGPGSMPSRLASRWVWFRSFARRPRLPSTSSSASPSHPLRIPTATATAHRRTCSVVPRISRILHSAPPHPLGLMKNLNFAYFCLVSFSHHHRLSTDWTTLSLDDLWTSRTGRQQPNNSSILTTTNSKRSSSRTSNSSRSSLRR